MITISILPNGTVSIYHDGKAVELPHAKDQTRNAHSENDRHRDH